MLHIIISCLEPLTKLSMLFQVLGLWLHLQEIFFLGLGPTVTEISIKKVQKQEFRLDSILVRIIIALKARL